MYFNVLQLYKVGVKIADSYTIRVKSFNLFKIQIHISPDVVEVFSTA